MRISTFLVAVTISALATASCGGPAPGGQYPPQPEGCDVKVFHEAPGVMTDNIGPVTATCAQDISDGDCMRTLKDQACKLGGDIVWGVSDVPSNVQGKKQFSGRAAHSKIAGK